MAKDWRVSQKALIAGVGHTVSFVLPNMEEAEVTSFCALLEGGYEITEINDAMSDTSNAEINAATSNAKTYIGMYGAQNQSARIAGFGGKAIHFKNTVSDDDIANVLKTVTPYPLLPTEKPKTITFKGYESVIS